MSKESLLTYSAGHTATVFGATGQLGRYIVNRLGMRLNCDSNMLTLLIREQLGKDVQWSSLFARK